MTAPSAGTLLDLHVPLLRPNKSCAPARQITSRVHVFSSFYPGLKLGFRKVVILPLRRPGNRSIFYKGEASFQCRSGPPGNSFLYLADTYVADSSSGVPSLDALSETVVSSDIVKEGAGTVEETTSVLSAEAHSTTSAALSDNIVQEAGENVVNAINNAPVVDIPAISEVTSSEAPVALDNPTLSEVTSSEAPVAVDIPALSEAAPGDAPVVSDIPALPEVAPAEITDSVQDALGGIQSSDIQGEQRLGAEALPLPSSNPDVEFSDFADNAVGNIQDSANEAITFVKNSVSGTFHAAQDAVTGFRDLIISNVQNSVDAGNQSIADTVKAITDTYDNALQSVQEATGGSISAAQDAASSTTRQLEIPQFSLPKVDIPIPEPVSEALQGANGVIQGVAETALSTVANGVEEIVSSVKGILPPEVVSALESAQEKVSDAAGPAAAFLTFLLHQALQAGSGLVVKAESALGIDLDDPKLKAGVVAGGAVLLGITYWRARYGGYSGDLSPEEALKLLRDEFNVILIDIRPQVLRDAEGIPDLRRSARFKDVAVEFTKLEGPVKKQVRNVEDTELRLWATIVRGLKGVGGGTKVVVLDQTGSQSKPVARALKKVGIQRPYRVEGGYRAWAASLRTRADAPLTPIAIIKEEAEAFVEEVKPTPLGVTAVFAGFGLGGYALYEWETTLQILGIIAIVQAVNMRIKSYSSLEDVKKDIRLALTPFNAAIGGIIWVSNLVESRLGGSSQLAMSPAAGSASYVDESSEEVEDSTDLEDAPPPEIIPSSSGAPELPKE